MQGNNGRSGTVVFSIRFQACAKAVHVLQSVVKQFNANLKP